jgi:hypothetical protein
VEEGASSLILFNVLKKQSFGKEMQFIKKWLLNFSSAAIGVIITS